MDRRWIGGIAGLLIVALAIFFLRRTPEPNANRPEPPADSSVEAVEDASGTPTMPDVVEFADASVEHVEPRHTTSQQPTLPYRAPEPPSDPNAPPANALATLAQRLCTYARANDRAGVLSVLGPGWASELRLDELRPQCTDAVMAATASNEPYGTAESIFGPIPVRRFATQSGLDPDHCVGMAFANGRIMACRDRSGEYRIAAVDFSPPEVSARGAEAAPPSADH